MHSNDGSRFHMIDVGEKAATKRRAIATGRIEMTAKAFEAIRSKTNPKGDVLAQAEVAGILAAKRTSDVIPLCHPLPLDQVVVRFELESSLNSVMVFCEAATTAKTGVEMEALSGVSGALLAIYDLSKAVDPVLKISDMHLVVKEGGKSGRWEYASQAVAELAVGPNRAQAESLEGKTAAILTISDRVSRGEATDASGPMIEKYLGTRAATIANRGLVPDDKGKIGAFLKQCAQQNLDLVLCTGGTGLAPRDVTPEAVEVVADRLVPGIGELLRQKGLAYTSRASLSRSIGAMVGPTLVITLPGSPKAVAEGLEILDEVLPHALEMARGGDHPRK